MWTKDELKQLSQIDIETINSNELLDITDLNIPPELSNEEKLELLSHCLKNPYCFKVGNISVKINFSKQHNQNLVDCLSDYFIKKLNSDYDKI